MNLKEIATTGVWLAAVVKVSSFAWEAYTQTYDSSSFQIGQTFINQTGPGQANDPANVPATPPTGKGSTPGQRAVAGFKGPDGKPLPFPPNRLLQAPNEGPLLQWLRQHGWTDPQIVAYLKSLFLNVPPNLTRRG